ncbi:MAG: SusC/RagA family TonB-linked outer membrane protein [Bacteroidales bacterium]|nr:SusC/RagA family TonB-linked outer membrane protein [Bacteroidales bacterium]
MKRPILVAGLIFYGALFCLQAQKSEVSGVVISAEDSLSIPGVAVFIKGTETGTITDMNGFYSLIVPSDTNILVYSFIGMESQEIPVYGKRIINVVLSPQAFQLKEIVVTALGIRRDSKALGYSATSVSSQEITRSRDRSILNSLQGKVAGVDISSSSGAPGASTRILLRGISSLSGSNQPLFIIDGVPVNNGFSGSTSINGGTDFGNGINDINPDDIESVNFLKGSGGAALYGSRAANGVIVITTKKGMAEGESKPEIAVTSSVTFEEPLRLIQYQNDFGQGIYGDAVSYENMSWGPPFDNKLRYWGNEVDNSLRVKAYTGLPDNIREFFDTGKSYHNSISFSNGNRETSYYFSYSNILHDGIFPTNSDSYNRHTLSFRGSTMLSDRFKATTSVNYVKKNNKSVPTGQGEQSVYYQIMQTPRDISLLELEDIENKWNNLDNYYSQYTVNPYFILKKNGNSNNEDRIYGNLEFSYDLTGNISAIYRLGADVSNEQLKSWRAVIDPEGHNEFTSIYEPGQVGESSSYVMQLNSDLILNFHQEFKNITVNALAGHNLNQRSAKSIYAAVNNLTIPDFYQISNTSETPSAGESFGRRRLVGVFGNIDVSYKSILFITATARNDWSSTLPKGNNSFFYPGVNTSFIFSELLPKFSRILSYGKLRLSWTRVGNDAPAYSVYNVFVTGGHSDGYGSLRYPLPNGVNSYEVSNLIGNENLKPELTSEIEAGTDLRLFNNRIGIDFTYYDKTTTNLIWPAPLSPSTGFSSKTINLGKLTNKGIEALLNLTPVKSGGFQWDLSFNFSKNSNKLVELTEGLDRIVFNGLTVDGGQQIYFVGKPGRPVGIFEGRTVMRDDQGRIVVDNTGLPKAAEDLIEYGDREYDFIGGIMNRLTFKGLSLSANLDIKQGGIMYSQTKDISVWAGTVPLTLYNMREPFVIPNSVYEIAKDASGDPVYAQNTIPVDAVHIGDYWGNGGTELDGMSFIDKSYIKLREIVLSYDFPRKLIGKIRLQGLELSVIGRNLLLWTPESQTYIDPELTTFGTDLNGDFGEYGAQPTVRSITFSLRLVL